MNARQVLFQPETPTATVHTVELQVPQPPLSGEEMVTVKHQVSLQFQ